MIDCFVTFCDDDARHVDIKVLLSELRARTDGKVKFYAYFENAAGSSLHDFMNKTLAECRCVLGLFGPGYKQRVDNTIERSGAYQEYNTIVTRMDGRLGPAKPRLIPVLWAGDGIDGSIPELLMTSNPIVTDLRKFRTLGQGHVEPYLPEKTREQCYPKLDEIAAALLLQEEVGSGEVQERALENLKRMVDPIGDETRNLRTVEDVLQIKYEHGDYTAEKFKETFYTKTRFTKQLNQKNVGLVSGRKGSGKTTLVQIREYEAQRTDFFPVLDISVKNWNLHGLIQNTSFTQSEGDFKYIDLEVRFFDFVWCAFVAQCMVVSLAYDEKENSGSFRGSGTYMNSEFSARSIDRLIEGAPKISDFFFSALFDHSVSTARLYIQKVVDQASAENEETFRQDVLQGISIKRFLFDIFGNEFSKLNSSVYARGNKRFLFCVDRFDTEIQQYRKIDAGLDPITRDRRAEREVNWLSSLTDFVNRTLRPDRLDKDVNVYEFFSKVKFLVVLPYDRVEEIRRHQRDSIASESVEEIYWQPKELLTMLRKRIQVLRGISDADFGKDNHKDALARFRNLCRIACPELPEGSFIALGAKKFEMDLFLYVLRHTFFRPRDVLIHYAAILAYLESVNGRYPRDTSGPIREIVSYQSQRIVDLEFLGELRDAWTNIDDVMKLFMGGEQILSNRDMTEIIGATDFKFHYSDSNITELSEKLEFLYGIGFLGFRSTRQVGSARNHDWFNFKFLSSGGALPFDSPKVMRHVELAIHPIFIESLFLQTSHVRPVLRLDWNRVNEMDRPT